MLLIEPLLASCYDRFVFNLGPIPIDYFDPCVCSDGLLHSGSGSRPVCLSLLPYGSSWYAANISDFCLMKWFCSLACLRSPDVSGM